MKMIKSILEAFKYPISITPEYTEKQNKQLEQKLISRISSGNVSLQRGQYISQQEVDLRFKKVCNHNFMN